MIDIKLMCPMCKSKDFSNFKEQEEYDNAIVEATCDKIINMLKENKINCKNDKINEVFSMIINNGYSSIIPTDEGTWWVVCNETDYECKPVELRLENGVMLVDDIELGVMPVRGYYDNLTNIRWKKDYMP